MCIYERDACILFLLLICIMVMLVLEMNGKPPSLLCSVIISMYRSYLWNTAYSMPCYTFSFPTPFYTMSVNSKVFRKKRKINILPQTAILRLQLPSSLKISFFFVCFFFFSSGNHFSNCIWKGRKIQERLSLESWHQRF